MIVWIYGLLRTFGASDVVRLWAGYAGRISLLHYYVSGGLVWIDFLSGCMPSLAIAALLPFASRALYTPEKHELAALMKLSRSSGNHGVRVRSCHFIFQWRLL